MSLGAVRRSVAHVLRTRAGLVALAATVFLAAGGVAWLREAGAPAAGGLTASRVWYAGLLLTGAPVVWQTVRGMARGHFASDVVAMLAVVTAIVLRQPLAGLVIVLMQSGGEALERYAEGRASAAVRELEAQAPRIAHRIGEQLEDVPVDAVAVGDELLVRPGELVPCDCVVVEGRSAVDVSRLTGEPVPLAATAGIALLSGSANGEGPLRVRATSLARESQYARIVELVRSAQASKAPLQRLADRYAVWFTPLTLAACAAAWAWSGDPLRVLAVLVVATPCPLILATPIAIIGGINRAARRQIIVRHGGALEQVGATTVAIFDKTGTLTIGHPEVERVASANGYSEHDLLRLAAAVEQGAGHPLARTLVGAAERELGPRGVHPARASDVVEAPGRGVSGVVEGHRVTVGARSLLEERHPEAAAELRALESRFAAEPGLRAWVAIDGTAAGVVEYADRVRPEAPGVIRELGALGITRTMVLSGDHPSNVESVARAVGLADARADLLPADKVAVIRGLIAGGDTVLMVGDGTNDAPALSAATVGMAIAAHGGGITAEAADVVLLTDNLSRVPEAIRIGRRTLSVARQSIVVGLGLSAVAMVFASLGFIRPTAGALLQEAIDVAVILNALRTSR